MKKAEEIVVREALRKLVDLLELIKPQEEARKKLREAMALLSDLL